MRRRSRQESCRDQPLKSEACGCRLSGSRLCSKPLHLSYGVFNNVQRITYLQYTARRDRNGHHNRGRLTRPTTPAEVERDLRSDERSDPGLPRGKPRPHDRQHGIADHRGRARRLRTPRRHRHRFHTDNSSDDPDLGQARRPLPAKNRLHDRVYDIPRRLRTLRHGARHDAADLLPRGPGAGGGRATRRRHRHHRRARTASRTGEVSRPDGHDHAPGDSQRPP